MQVERERLQAMRKEALQERFPFGATMTDFHIREDCRLCGGPLELVLDLGETALANEVWDDPSVKQDTFPLRLVQCTACGHMQNPVVVSPERLFRHYSYTSGLTESYLRHLDDYAVSMLEYIDPGDLVVEIGGNDGSLARCYEGTGIDYLNVDPSDVPQAWGERDRHFFSAQVARDIVQREGRKAKVIVANHVFAHVDDLHDMAAGVQALLSDDGVFFCEVGHGPTQLNSGCLDVIYHEHLSFHDAHSFLNFWAKHKLSPHGSEDVMYNGAQGGSIRLALRKTPGIGGWSRASDGPEFDIPRIKQASEHLRGLGDVIAELQTAMGRSGSGSGLAFYGAPAKLTTLRSLLEYHDIYDREAPIYDDSPRKLEKYAPGTDIRIRAPTLADLNRRAFIFIASWNFEKQIRERWSGYKGTWIVPLPEVRFYPGGGA